MAGLGLVALFDRHVERRVNVELHTFVTQIAGAIDFQPDGQPALSRALADPRFERPYGGLYWQIETDDHTKVRSRSLWDFVLTLPPPTEAAAGVAALAQRARTACGASLGLAVGAARSGPDGTTILDIALADGQRVEQIEHMLGGAPTLALARAAKSAMDFVRRTQEARVTAS